MCLPLVYFGNREESESGNRPKCEQSEGDSLTSDGAAMGKSIENRYSRQNYQASEKRITDVIDEGEVKQHARSQHKQERNHRISPDTIRPRDIGITAAEDKDRARGQHIKEPF